MLINKENPSFTRHETQYPIGLVLINKNNCIVPLSHPICRQKQLSRVRFASKEDSPRVFSVGLIQH